MSETDGGHPWLAIAHTGSTAVVQYPLRSAATVACVLAVLLPYVTGISLAKGLQQQAEDALRFGADVYVSGDQFGKNVSVPLALADEIRNIDGVTGVVPRIVAPIGLGKNNEPAVLVGMPAEHFPATVHCVEGRLPQPAKLNELVMGTELARRLNIHVGARLPPFYHNARGERISEVVGLFQADVAIWQANLVLTTLESAAAIGNQESLATDLLVSCRPGYQDSVRAAILRLHPLPSPGTEARLALRATTRADLQALLPTGLLHREGIFNLHFLLAFAVGILAVLVTSGVGTSERRREIGILKATGWQTDELLFRSLVESLLLSVAGAALAIVLAFVWLRLLNGYWIASIFLAGVDVHPGFRVPSRLTPVPALLAFVGALVLVMTGTLYSTWRTAVVPPRDAMR
ncbi:MAG TPA: FtsX-like permease family protein [Gemmataceae bacterium]|nr:FtsX-like permease family protein [Gemmataceae bacterium]